MIDTLEGWEGLVPRPAQSEDHVWMSLLYPLWGLRGLSFILILSAVWWAISLPTFAYVGMLVKGETRAGAPIRLLVPSVMGILVALGYTLSFLAHVLVTSAAGEVDHPRGPDSDLWELLRGLTRWVASAVAGVTVAGGPAILYGMYHEEITRVIGFGSTGSPGFDGAVLLIVFSLGLGYAVMALVASLMFDDLLAVNPVTVFQALWRVGWSFLIPCFACVAAVLLALGAWGLAIAIPIPLLSLAVFWAAWVFILYEAMVVMRIVGLEYYRHAAVLGWFHESARRRA